jgi:hypothetical protein
VAPGTGIPQGSVTFLIDGKKQATVNLSPSGVATLPPKFLSLGTHKITALYQSSSVNFLNCWLSIPQKMT